jgi:hypothetical protein
MMAKSLASLSTADVAISLGQPQPSLAFLSHFPLGINAHTRRKSETKFVLWHVASESRHIASIDIVWDQHNEIMFWGGYAHQGMQSATRADTAQTMCAMVNM